MSKQFILFQKENGVATITMNRPREMNSLNLEIIAEMNEALADCSMDENVRTVVLKGNDKAFSAGDDIKIMSMARGKSAAEIAEIIEKQGYPSLLKNIMSLPKPVIASINGVCYGAGGELAISCDYVIASDKATFGQLYINVGLIGNTYLLPKYVGVKKALELIWSGRVISAGEALQAGMINQLVPSDVLEEETQKIVNRFIAGPTLAYGLAKKAVYQSINLNINDGLQLMCQLQGQLMKSSDHLEGVAAFIEKRRPEFKGK